MTWLKKVLVTGSTKADLLKELKVCLDSDKFMGALADRLNDEAQEDEDDPEEAKDSAKRRLSYAMLKISKEAETDGNELIIWRCITSKDKAAYLEALKSGKYTNDKKDYKGAGVCWSFRFAKDMPTPAGNDGERLILKASVPTSSIDVNETAYLCCAYDFEDEKEIRLLRGAKLHILDIQDKDGHSLFGEDLKALPAVADK